MVAPAIGKLIVLAIGSSMWLWMQTYVKLQVYWHGEKILQPLRRTQPSEFTNSSYGEHKFQEVNNITMHYMEIGCEEGNNRTMLLMLHGFLDFWYIWNRLIANLSDQYCIVAPDMRGYGNTTRPNDSAAYLMRNLVEDVRGLLSILNPNHTRNVVLIGHDWGAMISFCFATLYETMINKMVIINGMHPMAFAKQLFRSIRQMRMSWYMLPFRHPVVPEKYLILDDLKFFNKVHRGFTTEEEYAHKYMFSQTGALTGAVNYYRAFNNDSDQLKKFPYRKINVSTLMLWGEEDEFITSRVAEYNREWLRGSIVFYYPNAGHWLLRECADTISGRIRLYASKNYELIARSDGAVMRWSSDDPCSEVITRSSRKSWMSRLFSSLPRAARLPKIMGE
uniref:Putative soluble epoxide hydrolase n=1 Tax=Hyalomma excavatum TaxID=257692 RepID=A0A131XP61_9ACAR